MESVKELYRIGIGPSSSHTMAPRKAAEEFKARNPIAEAFRVTLFGSLAATGKGHLTDKAIREALSPSPVEIIWKPGETLPAHPNGMEFEALVDREVVSKWRAYSIGGGALRDDEGFEPEADIYGQVTMCGLVDWTRMTGRTLWEYVEDHEGREIWEYLTRVWGVMKDTVNRGLNTTGALPGAIHLARRASSYYSKSRLFSPGLQRTSLLSAYAMAVAEENAAGGMVVCAPTCGSCGVLPAVLLYLQETHGSSDIDILHALATAGLVGNIVKSNASISGAEVGCQGEIGTACAMAAAAAVQLLGGTPAQMEYAAEMGIEHHLGLTCDPVEGLVQIPCIERNAFAATRAYDAAVFALVSDGTHRISFDEVVETMKQTGSDLEQSYRETSTGGLAAVYRESHVSKEMKDE